MTARIARAGLAVLLTLAAGVDEATAQSFRAQRQKEQQAELQAERAAKAPHPVSTAYQGTLTPVPNLAALLPGKTLFLQTPIVQNGQFQKVEVAPIYFAAGGQAYSSEWAARPWQIEQGAVCIGAAQQRNCMTALSDGAGQAFLLGPTKLLVQVGKITTGDTENVRQAYQTAQEAKAKATAQLVSVLGPLLLSAMFSGGGSSSSSNKTDYYYQYRSSGGSSGGGSSYTAPIGGETGLYGSCHGVGC